MSDIQVSQHCAAERGGGSEVGGGRLDRREEGVKGRMGKRLKIITCKQFHVLDDHFVLNFTTVLSISA